MPHVVGFEGPICCCAQKFMLAGFVCSFYRGHKCRGAVAEGLIELCPKEWNLHALTTAQKRMPMAMGVCTDYAQIVPGSTDVLWGITGNLRGVYSRYLMHIINSLIRISLEYRSFMLRDILNTHMDTLEIIYDTAVYIATGLPYWTTIPVLRKESNSTFIRICL